MGVGDYFSNMLFGPETGQSDQQKQGMEQLWKLYQQAYNVKPVWNGKAWIMPPGAVQRFQMLLPIIQAQVNAGRATGGQTGQQDYGLLGAGIKAGSNVLMKKGGDLLSEYIQKSGLGNKLTDLLGLGNYSKAPGFTPDIQQAASDYDQAFSSSAPSTPTFPTYPDAGAPTDFNVPGGEDWWSNIQIDPSSVDLSGLDFSGLDFSDWGW